MRNDTNSSSDQSDAGESLVSSSGSATTDASSDEPDQSSQNKGAKVLDIEDFTREDNPMTCEEWTELCQEIRLEEEVEKEYHGLGDYVGLGDFSDSIQEFVSLRDDVDTDLVDVLAPIILPRPEKYKNIARASNATLWQYAMPESKLTEEFGDWWPRLPAPKPSFTYGYSQKAFRRRLIDLQRCVIKNANDIPRDFQKISQPAEGLYWPFLVVEINSKARRGSLSAAKTRCAVSGVTCNRVVDMLHEAAYRVTNCDDNCRCNDDSDPHNETPTFSCAIDGWTAILSVHRIDEDESHFMTQIRSYSLAVHHEAKALRDQLERIVEWGSGVRHYEIHALLLELHQRTHPHTRIVFNPKDFDNEVKANEAYHKVFEKKRTGTKSDSDVPGKGKYVAPEVLLDVTQEAKNWKRLLPSRCGTFLMVVAALLSAIFVGRVFLALVDTRCYLAVLSLYGAGDQNPDTNDLRMV